MTIKRYAEDFRVEEILSNSVSQSVTSSSGRFALYSLEKSGLTTPDAVLALCRTLGVPGSAASYAGLKDKHAHTIQHVAVDVNALVGRDPVKELEGKGWSAQLLGGLDGPLGASAIAGNRFHICVRGLSARACQTMDEAQRHVHNFYCRQAE